MKKKPYIPPVIEVYAYRAERGYAHSVALHRDYVLVEGDDRETLRAADEVSEYTDDQGEWTTGLWE